MLNSNLSLEAALARLDSQETAWRQQLLQGMSLLSGAAHLVGFVTLTAMAVLLGQPYFLIPSGLSILSAPLIALCYRLAGPPKVDTVDKLKEAESESDRLMRLAQLTARHYKLGCRILVGNMWLAVALYWFVLGAEVPVVVAFFLAIAQANVLLSGRSTVLVTLATSVFSAAFYYSSYILKVSGLVSFSQDIHFMPALAVSIGIIPVITALITLPTRSQLKAITTQNLQLRQAYNELAARQVTSQKVGQRVLDLSAELTVTVHQQSTSSQQQAATVQQISSAMSELSQTAQHIDYFQGQVNALARRVAEDSQRIEQAADQTAWESEQGLTAISQNQRMSLEVSGRYEELLNALTELDLKNSGMQPIIALIGSIAAETHLLSLNAAIEAAGAGNQASERFKVVAQEVKRLALRSAEASREVVPIIVAIKEAFQQAMETARQGQAQSREMELVAQQAASVIEQMREMVFASKQQTGSISRSAQEVSQMTTQIRTVTTQQQQACHQVLESLLGLSGLSEQNARGSQFILSSVSVLQDLSQDLSLSLSMVSAE